MARTEAQEAPEYTEYQLKAAFLFNFVKFVEWPRSAFADSTSPIVIGIYGQDPFGESLDQIVRGKMVRGRRFEIRHFRAVNEVDSCQVLFISAAERGSIPAILARTRGKSILTVSEVEDFARVGGIINFVLRETQGRAQVHVRFQINPEAADRAHLRMSSQLLKLADIVTTEGR